MTKSDFSTLLAHGPLLLDGATGSNLMAAGMPRGVSTEAWVLAHPDVLTALQRQYAAAGCRAVMAPTFQANPVSQPEADLAAMIPALVALSRQAVGPDVLVAGDVSTTGRMAPLGPLSYEALVACYSDTVRLLEAAGVDYVAAETLLTEEEALAILDAASSVSGLPVTVSWTVEADGSLPFGGSVYDAAAAAAAMGAAAVGINCSSGPEQLESVVRHLRERVDVPILAKPNAGLPVIGEDGTAVYSLSPEDFAAAMVRLRAAGATLLGGCCGTTPAHLQALAAALT